MKKHSFKDGSVQYSRHPLAYIVEAADDISFLTADLEDAARADVITYDEAFSFLDNLARKALDSREERRTMMARAELVSDGDRAAKLRYLKDHAQRALKLACADVFVNYYDELIQGIPKKSLIKESNASALCQTITDYFNNNVYNNIGKTRSEVFGQAVIIGLLDFFFETLFEVKILIAQGNEISSSMSKRLSIFPMDNYFPDFGNHDTQVVESFMQLNNDQIGQMVVDYVSGMTDTYAADIFQQISGIQRPVANW